MAEFKRTMRCNDCNFETRAEDDSLYIDGYFAVFDSEYQLWDGAAERINQTAFDETIGDDIRALVNHDTTLVLGRTTAGTLKLATDNHGLYGSITINNADQDAVNLYERVKRGDVSQCSFGFDILAQSSEIRSDGSVLWTIEKLKLYEVSVVTFPAYESTSVEARRRDFDKEMEKWRKEQRTKIEKK